MSEGGKVTSRASPNLPGLRVALPRVRLFRQIITDWFSANGRDFPWRDRRLSYYELVVAEILLQRTRAETVASFYPRFIKRFPDWASLATAGVVEVEVQLRPVGLWARRARGLVQLAQRLSRSPTLPCSREKLEELPAVGQYIASAILLLVHERREPLLDSSMARLIERFFGPREEADIRYSPYLQSLSRSILSNGDPVLLNWAMLDLAALVCVPRDPDCAVCPLSGCCRYASIVGVREWSRSDVRIATHPVGVSGSGE